MSKSSKTNSSNRRGQTTLPAKSGRRKPGLSGSSLSILPVAADLRRLRSLSGHEGVETTETGDTRERPSYYNQGSAKTTDKYCPTLETRQAKLNQKATGGSFCPMPNHPDVDKAGSQESLCKNKDCKKMIRHIGINKVPCQECMDIQYSPKSPPHKGDKARGFRTPLFPSSLSNPRQVSFGSSGASTGAKCSQAEDLSFIEILKILRGF